MLIFYSLPAGWSASVDIREVKYLQSRFPQQEIARVVPVSDEVKGRDCEPG